jgi:hypothetical protein
MACEQVFAPGFFVEGFEDGEFYSGGQPGGGAVYPNVLSTIPEADEYVLYYFFGGFFAFGVVEANGEEFVPVAIV